MLNNTLVSIIIPTYNRAHLIGETLDSVLVQTYTNWECLVIDDGSDDNTDSVLKMYCKKDGRFSYIKRPSSKQKGANACRNIGLDSAKGDYIVFFDSDDLMTQNHLEVKVNALQNSDYDFVITRTEYFNFSNKRLHHYYTFNEVTLTAYNYILQHVNWLTLDVCIRRSVLENLRFNEKLQSGQEYNYFSKLVLRTTKAIFIDKVVSLRRAHDTSTQGKLQSKSQKAISSFLAQWYTFQDVEKQLNSETKKALLYKCIKHVYYLKEVPKNNFWFLTRRIFQNYKLSGFNFLTMYFFRKYFNRGYAFRSRLKP